MKSLPRRSWIRMPVRVTFIRHTGISSGRAAGNRAVTEGIPVALARVPNACSAVDQCRHEIATVIVLVPGPIAHQLVCREVASVAISSAVVGEPGVRAANWMAVPIDKHSSGAAGCSAQDAAHVVRTMRPIGDRPGRHTHDTRCRQTGQQSSESSFRRHVVILSRAHMRSRTRHSVGRCLAQSCLPYISRRKLRNPPPGTSSFSREFHKRRAGRHLESRILPRYGGLRAASGPTRSGLVPVIGTTPRRATLDALGVFHSRDAKNRGRPARLSLRFLRYFVNYE
jgi:hypothetical protein